MATGDNVPGAANEITSSVRRAAATASITRSEKNQLAGDFEAGDPQQKSGGAVVRHETALDQLFAEPGAGGDGALPEAAARDLLARLGQTSAPAVCPHGSPVVLHLSGGMLKRLFRW